VGSNKAGSSYDENRGGTSFQNDLAAMTRVAKKKGLYQGARSEAVADFRKSYGRNIKRPYPFGTYLSGRVGDRNKKTA